MIYFFLILLFCWVLFNLVSPWAVVAGAQRMSVANLPGEILVRANSGKVKFYRTNLFGGFALTLWAWPYQIVVMDNSFLKGAPPNVIRYVLAHELGHCVLGHTWKKWISAVTGAALFPSVRRWMLRGEDEADDYAEKLSGVPRSVLRGESKADVIYYGGKAG